MGQPKAKWERDPENGGWRADVGPFHLEVNTACDGRAELYDSEWKGLWDHRPAEPYDIVDLMLLSEAELKRRLRGAADTMDGKELVAEQEAVPAPCVSCSRLGSPNPGGWCGECGRMPVAVDLCDFELCAEQATRPRAGMAYCVQHAREHDENVAQALGVCARCGDRLFRNERPNEQGWCATCAGNDDAGKARDAALAQAKRDNPMMVSETCTHCAGKPFIAMSYGMARPCQMCNGTSMVTRRATAEEEWGHERAKPTFEAARKMLNAPALLHPVDTSDKTPVGTVERVNDDGTVLVRVGGVEKRMATHQTMLKLAGAMDTGKSFEAFKAGLSEGPAAGSREWAIEQMRQNERAILSWQDSVEYERYTSDTGSTYIRCTQRIGDKYYYSEHFELPHVSTGWRLLK